MQWRALSMTLGMVMVIIFSVIRQKNAMRSLPAPAPEQAMAVEKQVTVEDKRALVEAAEAEAMRRFPEFLKAFANRSRGQVFMVKAEFAEGGVKEQIWVQVNQISEDTLNGTVLDEPNLLKNVSAGQRVSTTFSTVCDWIYRDPAKGTVGDFTDSAGADRP